MIGAAVVLIIIIFNPTELRMKMLIFPLCNSFQLLFAFVVVVALVFSVLWSNFCNPLSICSLFKAWLTGLLGCSFDLFSCLFFHT